MSDSNSSFFGFDNDSEASLFNGVPVGGTSGQVLKKLSATDYDYTWAEDLSGGTVSDATITITDITTNNFSTTKHGWVPKGTNVGSFLKDDGTWAAIVGGGDALVANPLSQFAATTSLQLKGVLSDETGSGALVFATSPTLVTPALGVATATSINGATITSGTLNGSVTGTNTGDQTATSLGLGTADSPQFTAVNIGHATDTTVARSAAGQISVEGNRIVNVGDRAVVGCVIDGGGTTITTGIKGDIGPFEFACTIEAISLLADQSGSIVIDIWKDSYTNYPPTVADTIPAAAKPTITTATKSQDTTLTGWTTAIAVGDILRFNVDSVTTIQRATLTMKVKKT